ncbi:hypothetical protein KTO58_15025 [Chitinophaga pendula]|uniref:hypothetical protein n=1 Tax=Chitinophaga TaxID=79328 RepID=UPI0012FDDC9A|nr:MULTISPECIES: hypothetical protein [Chitinophaga]UCJ05010.1 hypothetical protein KTO58_15025 [Chitinophaga pendula]
MISQQTLESYLLAALKERIHIPQHFSDELITLNLLYLFSRDDDAAIKWVAFIEEKFEINIPDNEVDYFFLSSIRHMATVINRCISPGI